MLCELSRQRYKQVVAASWMRALDTVDKVTL